MCSHFDRVSGLVKPVLQRLQNGFVRGWVFLLLLLWALLPCLSEGLVRSAVSSPRIYDPFRVSTLLGSNAGWRDGTAAKALLNQPASVAVDPSGRIWIAESVILGPYTAGVGAHRVRRFDPVTGVVTTVAGASQPGYLDGTGVAARFRGPSGFAFDKRGNTFVTDRLNHRIRKIGANGVVTTFAGSGLGLRDGPALKARFHLPIGLAMDAEENLYVADFGNHRIRKISAVGVVTTLAGSSGGFRDGFRYSALFNGPTGLALLEDGSLIVGDWVNGALRRVSPDGRVVTVAFDLGYVQQVVVSAAGALYAVHTPPGVEGRNAITRFALDGADQWTFAPPAGYLDGPVNQSEFSMKLGDVAPLDEARLLIIDTLNHRLRVLEMVPRATLTLSPPSGLFTTQLEFLAKVDLPEAEVRLTLDGTEPTSQSRLYVKPIVLTAGTVVKARAFVQGLPRSHLEERRFERVYAVDDGILPAWREGFFGPGYVTDPRVSALADPDGDGYSNQQEFLGHTDPTDIRSFPFEQKKPVDFNGDGNADLLLQNEEGFLAAWFMRGEDVVNASSFNPNTTKDPNLRLVGVGDFNRDLKPDLLFQHGAGPEEGRLVVWLMEGMLLSELSDVVEGPVEVGWTAVGVGDYNFDGWPDIIGQRTDGVMSAKFCHGTTVIGKAKFQPEAPLTGTGQIDLAWRLVANADVNNDGRMDLVFQREGGFSRPLAVWTMNGLNLVKASLLQPSDPGAGWSLAGTADFNNDGKPDFLFQQSGGNYGIWFMNDVNRIRSSPLFPETAGPGWRIAGPR